MISFACPSCRKTLKGKETLAGKQVKCPACGKPFTVQPAGAPAPAPAAPPVAVAVSPASPPPQPESGPLGDEEAIDDEPGEPAAKGFPAKKIVIGAVAALALALIAAGALFAVGGKHGYDPSIPMVKSIKVDEITVVAAEPNTTLHGLEAEREYSVMIDDQLLSPDSGCMVRFFFPWKEGRFFLVGDDNLRFLKSEVYSVKGQAVGVSCLVFAKDSSVKIPVVRVGPVRDDAGRRRAVGVLKTLLEQRPAFLDFEDGVRFDGTWIVKPEELREERKVE